MGNKNNPSQAPVKQQGNSTMSQSKPSTTSSFTPGTGRKLNSSTNTLSGNPASTNNNTNQTKTNNQNQQTQDNNKRQPTREEIRA